jgi:hypothetical protein
VVFPDDVPRERCEAPSKNGRSSDQEAQMPTTAEKRKVTAKRVTPKKAKVSRAGKSPIERTGELSEQVLDQVKRSQESAIEAVRHFMESVDEALPAIGDRPSRRQDVVDSALEMSEKLVQTQYDFLRNVVHSAGETLGGSGRKGASSKKK